MKTVPLFETVTNTVGLNGDQITVCKYSLNPGSKTATGLLLRTSYIRTAPSTLQVRKSRLMNGLHTRPVTGPICFSKLDVKGEGYNYLISGFALNTV
jgi:hypothetical protein